MKNILKKTGIKALPFLLNTLIRTLRIRVHNRPDDKLNFVFVFWHSQMLIGWWLFKDRRSVALVSQSKDGNILNKVLEGWNYRVTRGSSSKRGKEALNEVIDLVKENYSAVITPDGPRGPAKDFKNGALMVSNKTGIPVVPVRIIFQRKKILSRSWDKFEIPFPFSECDVYFGNKYSYEKMLDENELITFKRTISEEM